MDHGIAAWLLSGVTVLGLVAATALGAQRYALERRRSTTLPHYRNRLLRASDEQTGAPLEHVEVMDLMAGTTAVTTRVGTVSLAFLPEGGSLVRLRKVGYAPVTLTVAISETDTAPFTVLMRRSPQDEAMVVTRNSAPRYLSPGLLGFEERRRAGLGGQFVDDATLRTMDGEVMSVVLRRIHGANLNGGGLVSARRTPAGFAPKSHRRGTTGSVSVYENGIRRASLTPMDFGNLPVEDYAGVEFYSGTETYPVWISRTDNDCGVLLLWTREK